MYTFSAFNKTYGVGMKYGIFLFLFFSFFSPANAEESSEMYVKRVLKELKKENRTSSEMVRSVKRVIEPRLKKDSTGVEILTSKDLHKNIIKMKVVQESGSGMVETTDREFHYFKGELFFISVIKKLENTFVNSEPFLTERRVFIKNAEIVKTTFKQGSKKAYKREKFYPQARGTKSWKEAELLCRLARDVKNQIH